MKHTAEPVTSALVVDHGNILLSIVRLMRINRVEYDESDLSLTSLFEAEAGAYIPL